MADAGFYRGTSSEQDSRFTDKERKLLKQMRFDGSLDQKICMDRVNLDVIKPWITAKLNAILGMEDDVLIEYVFSQLEEKELNPKVMQINLTGFLNARCAREFMGELWSMLLEAQDSESGIPSSLVERKMKEIQEKAKDLNISSANGSSAENASSDWKNRYDSLTGGKFVARDKDHIPDHGGDDFGVHGRGDSRHRDRGSDRAKTRMDAISYKNEDSIRDRDVKGEKKREKEVRPSKRRESRSPKRHYSRSPRRRDSRSPRRRDSRSPRRRHLYDERIDRRRDKSRTPIRSPPRRRFTERKEESKRRDREDEPHRRKHDNSASDSGEQKHRKKKKKHSKKKRGSDSESELIEKKKKKRKKEKKRKRSHHSSGSE